MRRVRGLKFLTTQIEVVTDPVSGNTSGIVIEGEASDVQGQQGAYQAAGARTRFTQQEGFGRLEVTFGNATGVEGSQEYPVYDWSFDGVTSQKDLKEHPTSLGLGISVIEDIEAKLRDKDADVTIPTGDATTLYELYKYGNTAFYEGAPVLRKNITVSQGYEIPVALASLSGYGQIWTSQLVHDDEGSMFPWVSVIMNAIEQLAIAGGVPTGYRFGWLKFLPRIEQRWGQKQEITQEWWGAIWKIQGASDGYVYQTA